MKAQLDILVVDDDADNANSLAELFEMEGHRPQVAYSGVEAIRACHESSFDLAFVDVMMPGLNGVESFMEIRKLRPTAKVFMMSGYSVEELLRQATDHGALGLLSKPVPPETILDLVQEIGRNGLVVAQGQGPYYTQQLTAGMVQRGARFRLMQPMSALRQEDLESVLIIEARGSLIDSVGHYAGLRKANELPPTVILAAPSEPNGDVLRDINVTGILTKPFDPEDVIAKLQGLAA